MFGVYLGIPQHAYLRISQPLLDAAVPRILELSHYGVVETGVEQKLSIRRKP
jgi:hypothetical protein